MPLYSTYIICATIFSRHASDRLVCNIIHWCPRRPANQSTMDCLANDNTLCNEMNVVSVLDRLFSYSADDVKLNVAV